MQFLAAIVIGFWMVGEMLVLVVGTPKKTDITPVHTDDR